MTKTILGVFDERASVEEVIDKLRAEGFNPKDISIVMKDTRQAEEIADDTGVGDVVGGAAAGATTGAILGGLAGLIAAVALPGLGAFFIGGPIAAALGLGGAAASTASGAVTGAAAGGLLGALASAFGLSDEEARTYEERINQGAILLAVPASGEDISYVTSVFDEYDATDVKTIDQLEPRHEEVDTRPRMHQSTIGAKGGRTSRGDSDGRGWHGDSEEHAEAGRGRDVPRRGRGR